MKVAVIGASGFIGSAICLALGGEGHDVIPIGGLRVSDVNPVDLVEGGWSDESLTDRIAAQATEAGAVILAAGDPDASSADEGRLFAANAALPMAVARAVRSMSPQPRLVHVSSAVVQGRRAVLDASEETDGFSTYARSKIMGEQLIQRELASGYVIYRPPSVHAADRRVTRAIVRLAQSPLRSVASPGDSPSPQALIQNVASALSFLATTQTEPPSVVIHPWEGMTTGGLMRALGGRDPRIVPRAVARAGVAAARVMAHVWRPLEANARRIEVVWFGQKQAPSWLLEAGWAPIASSTAWQDLRTKVLADNEATRRAR